MSNKIIYYLKGNFIKYTNFMLTAIVVLVLINKFNLNIIANSLGSIASAITLK